MNGRSQEVMIVRHPQTERNKAGCYIGRGDSPLTPTGHAQVRWLTRVVRTWEPDVTFSSPLGRAQDAARAMTPRGTAVHVVDDLQEIDFGDAEGHTYDELVAKGIRLDYETEGPVAPNGEPVAEFRARVHAAAEMIARDGRRTLVVTHGGIMRQLLAYWLELPFSAAWRFAVPNASLAVVRLADGTGVLEGLTPPPEDPAHRPSRRQRPWLP